MYINVPNCIFHNSQKIETTYIVYQLMNEYTKFGKSMQLNIS